MRALERSGGKGDTLTDLGRTDPNIHEKGVIQTVGLEEHAWTPQLLDAQRGQPVDRYDDSVSLQTARQIASRLLDLGDQRIQHMDDAGIDKAVLSISTPGTQNLPPVDAVALSRDANDQLAAVVGAHPDRFAAFATLPTPDPMAAAAELRRAVGELGFVGAMLFPRTGDRYLDHDSFHPLLQVAADLAVPLYLHPEIAPLPVREATYGGFSQDVSLSLATGGWGWHVDAGLGALRLILAGTFDRHPDLQIILGHWGEMLVYFHERVDAMSDAATYLDRRVGEYVTGNIHVTPSGILSYRMLAHAAAVIGTDRILFSSDYPFIPLRDGQARAFVENAPISPTDRNKFGYTNANRLLKL